MAGNKEIEVEDFATIAQTNNILGSSISGGGGAEFVAKIQAISGGARKDLLTSYSSMNSYLYRKYKSLLIICRF